MSTHKGMRENGSDRKRTIWGEVAGQVADHVDLASLELRYESQQVAKRLIAFGIILVLVMTGFIVLQVSLVGYLTKFGLSLGTSALILGGFYFILAIVVYFALARRGKRVGPPFAATQRELRETIEWIQKILS